MIATTTYSWPATANVIELTGAEPLFIDIDPRTFNLDPQCLEARLREQMARPGTSRRLKAILPVHAFGGPADMPRILEIADTFGVPVVEDAACALGAEIAGRRTGSWGKAGCFSFHPRKAVTTGEGGIITTNDASIAKRARILRNHGLDPDAAAPDFVMPGYNLRLTEFQAALGTSQMAKLPRILDARRAAAARYDSLLLPSSVVRPVVADSSLHTYQSYVVLLPVRAADSRDRVIRELKARGIETTIGTYHLPATTYYRQRYGYRPGQWAVSEDVSARALSLPLFETITAQQQVEVTEAVIQSIAAEVAV